MEKKKIIGLLGINLFFLGGFVNRVEAAELVPKEEVNQINQLQQKYNEIYNNFPSNDIFSKNPVLSNGIYELGVFNTNHVESNTKMINFYRELAGVKPLEYTTEAADFAQHGAIGMAAVNKQGHDIGTTMTKPVGMSDEFWATASLSAEESSIHSSKDEHSFQYFLNSFIVDYGSGNLRTGHRKNILGLTASDYGWGLAQGTDGKYYTTLNTSTIDISKFREYETDFITQWPSKGVFPYELYNIGNVYNTDYHRDSTDPKESKLYEKNMRWSVFLHQSHFVSADKIKVTLIDNETGIATEMKNDDNGGELTVSDYTSPTGKGITLGGFDVIAFRPNNDYEVNKNTLYTVKISGIEKSDGTTMDYEYNTRFVGMYDEYEANVPVEAIQLTPTEINLGVGETQKLVAVVSPVNASNKAVTWSSSNPAVAAVNTDGIVTAKSTGTSVITATTVDGKKTASSIVKVTEAVTGTYGTVPWTWNEETQTLTFGGGEFPDVNFQNNIRAVIETNHLNGKKIKHLKFTKPVTANENSSYLFYALTELENIEGIANLDTSNVTNMESMFGATYALKKLDLNSWNTSKVTTMNRMFASSKMTELKANSLDTSNVTNMYAMFNLSSEITRLDINNWDTSKVTDMRQMFNGTTNLCTVDISNWDTGNVTSFNMLFNRSGITSLDLNNWDTSKVTNMNSAFDTARNLKVLHVENWDVSNVTTMRYTFARMDQLTSLNLNKWNTGKVVDMYSMFRTTAKLSNLEIDNWDTSNVKIMDGMFASAKGISSLDLNKWNTVSLVDARSMFSQSNIQQVKFSNWDTRNLEMTAGMFSYTLKIEKLDFSGWDTSKLTIDSGMFTSSNLHTLVLGKKSIFSENINLYEVSTNNGFYTSRWIGPNGTENPTVIHESSKALVNNYDGSQPGTYTREKVQ